MAAAEITEIPPCQVFLASPALPNWSVKPTRNIRPRWPRGTHGNVAPRGQHVLLSRAAYLER